MVAPARKTSAHRYPAAGGQTSSIVVLSRKTCSRWTSWGTGRPRGRRPRPDRVVGVLLGEEGHAAEEMILLDRTARRLDADRVAALTDRDALATALGERAATPSLRASSMDASTKPAAGWQSASPWRW